MPESGGGSKQAYMDRSWMLAQIDDVEALVKKVGLGDTFSQTPWWGWLVLLGGLFLGVAVGKLVSGLLRKFADRSAAKGQPVRETVLNSIAGPVALALLTLGIAIGLTSIALSDEVRAVTAGGIRLLNIVAIAWFLFNLVELVDLTLRRVTSRSQSKLDDQLVPLVRKTLRLFLLIVFVLFAAENVFGANISAWLAGLGIAGLAVSLAAQDSIRNFFGSLTIFVDRPFQVGDLIKLGDAQGNVEEIGFRSTKLRTLSGEMVTIPNSKIVDQSVTNVSRRPSIQRIMDVTITYDTPSDKVQQAIDILRNILTDPSIAASFRMEKFPPRVYFTDFKADSLNIRVIYWHFPADWWAYCAHAERINLMLLQRYNDAGIEFAFPTQTLLLSSDPARGLSVMLQRDPDATVDSDARSGRNDAQ